LGDWSEARGKEKDGFDLLRINGTQGSRQPGLGLEGHRQSSGVTLEEISEATKISRRFLKAIEDGCYQELPGGVFTISYIRQYAAAVGYNAEIILEHYERSLAPDELPVGKKPVAKEQDGTTLPLSKWANRFFSIG
jgi:cytoskeletal protein RodZ